MVFSEYMNSLSTKTGISEKRAKVLEIAVATCRNETAVYAWINGDREPDMLAKKTIAAVINIPVEELFPEKK